jgi:hypothetical protein
MVPGISTPSTRVQKCDQEYKKFLERKKTLHIKAWQFAGNAKNQYPQKGAEAERIAKLIEGDWQKIRPHGLAEPLGFDPFGQATEEFKLSQWANVGETALYTALTACGEAFNWVRGFYEKLSAAEKLQAIPGGLKP